MKLYENEKVKYKEGIEGYFFLRRRMFKRMIRSKLRRRRFWRRGKFLRRRRFRRFSRFRKSRRLRRR